MLWSTIQMMLRISGQNLTVVLALVMVNFIRFMILQRSHPSPSFPSMQNLPPSANMTWFWPLIPVLCLLMKISYKSSSWIYFFMTFLLFLLLLVKKKIVRRSESYSKIWRKHERRKRATSKWNHHCIVPKGNHYL